MRGVLRRSKSQASTSLRSHTTQRGESAKRRGKFSALLHFVDGAVGKGNHFAKLLSPNGALDGGNLPMGHDIVLQAIEINRSRLRSRWPLGNREASRSYKKKPWADFSICSKFPRVEGLASANGQVAIG